jgi:hypothetical protein
MRTIVTALALAAVAGAWTETAAQDKKSAAVYTATVKIDDV